MLDLILTLSLCLLTHRFNRRLLLGAAHLQLRGSIAYNLSLPLFLGYSPRLGLTNRSRVCKVMAIIFFSPAAARYRATGSAIPLLAVFFFILILPVRGRDL